MNKGDKKKEYESWAVGWMWKGVKVFHPYLEKGFVFDSEKK